jgi:hypothetical protein
MQDTTLRSFRKDTTPRPGRCARRDPPQAEPKASRRVTAQRLKSQLSIKRPGIPRASSTDHLES